MTTEPVERFSEALDQLNSMKSYVLSERGMHLIRTRGDLLSAGTPTNITPDEAIRGFAELLTDAEPFYWSSSLISIIEASAFSLPETWRLTDPVLPSMHGWIWFARPLRITPHKRVGGCITYSEVTALSWMRHRKSLFMDLAIYAKPDKDETLAALFDSAGDENPSPEDYEKSWTLAEQVTNISRSAGVPWQIIPWKSGETIAQATADIMGMPVNGIPDMITDDVYCRQCHLNQLRIFAACLNFMQQRVFVSAKREADRGTRRRNKMKWNQVNYVVLRRAERVKHESDVEHKDVDWSCHWLVGARDGGHWRHQPIKNQNGEWVKEWRWIATYVKGDLKKPFKPPAQQRQFLITR